MHPLRCFYLRNKTSYSFKKMDVLYLLWLKMKCDNSVTFDIGVTELFAKNCRLFLLSY